MTRMGRQVSLQGSSRGSHTWTGRSWTLILLKGPVRAPLLRAEENMLTKPPFLLIRGENVVSYFHTESRSPRENKTTEIHFLTRGPSGFRAPAVGIKELQILSPSLSLTNHNELNQCLCFHLHFCLGIWINKITGKKKKNLDLP